MFVKKKICNLHSSRIQPFWQLSLLDDFAVNENAKTFVDQKLNSILPKTFLCTFRGERSARKKMQNLRNEFSQIFV